jgi:hypothetical protein
VAALERVGEKLKLYRASMLKAAVEGVLTAEWRAEHRLTEPASELLQRILAERRRRWEEDQLARLNAKGQEPPRNWKAKYKEPVPPTQPTCRRAGRVVLVECRSAIRCGSVCNTVLSSWVLIEGGVLPCAPAMPDLKIGSTVIRRSPE